MATAARTAPPTRRGGRLRAVATALALVLAAGACDDGDGGAGPVEGGTLRVATVGPLGLDPAGAVDRPRAMLADLVFDPLVTLDPATGEPAPGVAASWEVDDDQRTFTFTVDDDARFHDGSRVTADDVVASWARVVDPATGSSLAALLAPVAGFAAARAGDGELAGARARDDDTVVVELEEPLSDFPANLAHPGLGIVRAEGLDEEAPVGSGPFAVDEHDEHQVRLTRAEGRDAYLDAVEVRAADEPAEAVSVVEEGAADVVLVEGSAEAPRGATEQRAPYLAVTYYGLNLGDPALADERFREAIVLAIDPAPVVEASYGARAEVAASVAPSSLPGVGTDVCGERCGPDRARARSLLAEVFGDAPPSAVTVDFDATDVQTDVAAALADQLEAVGIPVELRPFPPDEYDEFLANEEPGLFRLGSVSDVAAVRGFLAPSFVPDAPENVVRLEDGAVSVALEAAATATDADARARAYRDAQRAVLDAFAVVPLAELATRYAHDAAVRDLEISVFGTFSGDQVWLAPQED